MGIICSHDYNMKADFDAVQYALETNKLEIANKRLQNIDIRATTNNGQTHLIFGCGYSSAEVMKLLFDKIKKTAGTTALFNNQLLATDDSNTTCLMSACGNSTRRSPDVVKLVLDKIDEVGDKDLLKSQLTATNRDGWTCLMRACGNSSSPEVVKLIFEKIDEVGDKRLLKSQLTATNGGGNNCLMTACENSSSSEVVKLIFQRIIKAGGPELLKTQLSATNKKHSNCLMLACLRFPRSSAVIKLLAVALYCLDLFKQQQATAVKLGYAYELKDAAIPYSYCGRLSDWTPDQKDFALELFFMRTLLQEGSPEKFDALRRALEENNVEKVKKSLQTLDITRSDGNNLNCLMYACRYSSSQEIVNLVFEKIYEAGSTKLLESQLSAKDRFGSNCLMLCSESRCLRVMKLLLDKILEVGGPALFQSQLTATDGKNGSTCLMLACSKFSSPNIVMFLFDKISEIGGPALLKRQLTATDSKGWTCLMLACSFSSSREVVKLVFEKIVETGDTALLKSQFTATDICGMNCLMLACRNSSSPEVMKLLLDKIDVAGGFDLFKSQLAATDNDGCNCLMIASELSSSRKVVKLVLRKVVETGGMDLLKSQFTMIDNYGRTCLVLCCYRYKSSSEVAKLVATLFVQLDLFKQQYVKISSNLQNELKGKSGIDSSSWTPDAASLAEVKAIMQGTDAALAKKNAEEQAVFAKKKLDGELEEFFAAGVEALLAKKNQAEEEAAALAKKKKAEKDAAALVEKKKAEEQAALAKKKAQEEAALAKKKSEDKKKAEEQTVIANKKKKKAEEEAAALAKKKKAEKDAAALAKKLFEEEATARKIMAEEQAVIANKKKKKAEEEAAALAEKKKKAEDEAAALAKKAQAEEETAKMKKNSPVGITRIQESTLNIDRKAPIGSGATCSVYSCNYSSTECAAKMFHSHITSNKAVQREMNAAVHLKHPNIVNVLAIIVDDTDKDKIIGILMQRMNGTLLQRATNAAPFDKTAPVTVPELIKLCSQTASGILCAHSLKCIHCDIKPENVMLDLQGNANLADFGSAHVITTVATNVTSVRGTALYIAPEYAALDVEEPNEKTDVFSFGMLMWVVFHANKDHGMGKSEMQIGRSLDRGKRPEIDETKLPSEIVSLIEKCWDEDADERPAIADALTVFNEVLSRIEQSNKVAISPLWTDARYLKSKHRSIADHLATLKWNSPADAPSLHFSADITDRSSPLFKFIEQRFRPSLGFKKAENNHSDTHFSGKFSRLQMVQPADAHSLFLALHEADGSSRSANAFLRHKNNSDSATHNALEKLKSVFEDPEVNPTTNNPNFSRIVFGWHGTNASVAEKVCRDGPRSLRLTDAGFFGAGSYFSLEADYAAQYARMSSANAKGEYAIILFAVSLSQTYPITLQHDYRSKEDSHRPEMHGFSNFYNGPDPKKAIALAPKCDSHFIPVKKHGDGTQHPLGRYTTVNGNTVVEKDKTRVACNLDQQACDAKDPEVFGHEIVILNHQRAVPVAILYFK